MNECTTCGFEHGTHRKTCPSHDKNRGAQPVAFVKADADKPRLNLLPPAAIAAMGRAFTYGAKKYAPDNWRKCDDAGRYSAAALRHIFDHLDGKIVDDESGLDPLDHAIASLAMLIGLRAQKVTP